MYRYALFVAVIVSVLFVNLNDYREALAAELSINKTSITFSGDINKEDRVKLAAALEKSPNIKTIILNSDGGLTDVAKELADLIIDYELDTHVVDKCLSACTDLLLAGKKRTLKRGSKIGFHQPSWDLEGIKETYENSPEAWNNDVFEFAIWVDEVAMSTNFDHLKYLLERGVAPLFAIKSLQAQSDDMWYPRRKDLLEAGVLTK